MSDSSFMYLQAANERYAAECDLRLPSNMYKPKLLIDGNLWCALYGDNLQDGVAGFGKSPGLAYWDFDKAWWEELHLNERG